MSDDLDELECWPFSKKDWFDAQEELRELKSELSELKKQQGPEWRVVENRKNKGKGKRQY